MWKHFLVYFIILQDPVQPQCVHIAHVIFTFQKFPNCRFFCFLTHMIHYILLLIICVKLMLFSIKGLLQEGLLTLRVHNLFYNLRFL